MSKKKIILITLAVLLLTSQLIRIDKTPMKVDPSLHIEQNVNVPDNIKIYLKNACYDCHSAETDYPWYSNITLVAIWLRSHVRGARQHLNFADWASYDEEKQHHKLEEIIEVLELQTMPIKSYKWMHPEAKLTDDDYAALLTYFGELRQGR